MRRVAPLVFVAAIGAVALYDGIRGRADDPLAHRLGAAGVTGTLYVSDPACRLIAVRLPALSEVSAPRVRACRFAISPSYAGRSSWYPWRSPGALAARSSPDGAVDVAPTIGDPVRFIRGHAPAWRPDGDFTYLRAGEVVRFPPHGRAETGVAQASIESALGVGPSALSWDGSGRAVIAGGRSVAVFADGASAAIAALDRPVTDVQAARDGRIAAVGGGSVVILDARLRTVRRLTGDAAAWSPDGRWLAVVERGTVTLVEASGPRSISLPLAARAVAWR
jgi:hypothetical protein